MFFFNNLFKKTHSVTEPNWYQPVFMQNLCPIIFKTCCSSCFKMIIKKQKQNKIPLQSVKVRKGLWSLLHVMTNGLTRKFRFYANYPIFCWLLSTFMVNSFLATTNKTVLLMTLLKILMIFVKLVAERCVMIANGGPSVTCDWLYNRTLRRTEPSCEPFLSQLNTWQSGGATSCRPPFFRVVKRCTKQAGGEKKKKKKTKYDAHLKSAFIKPKLLSLQYSVKSSEVLMCTIDWHLHEHSGGLCSVEHEHAL